MPTYGYQCSECNHEFEIYQSVKDSVKRKCPVCLRLKLERIIYPVAGKVKEIRTLGQLAEKNTKRAGGSLDTEERAKSEKLKAERRKIAEINKMTNKQKINYIEGGT